MALAPETSIDARLVTEDGICAITHDTLDTDAIVQSVGDGSAGATAVFIGTTRNSFKGAC
jgi:molybdopterin synthase catalytic subunit